MYRKKLSVSIIIVLLIGLVLVSTIPLPQISARLVLNKVFSPSAVTYTNKTFHFQDSDPYTYAYWQYNVGTTTNTQNTNRYAMDTDTDGEYAYFGFDEFVNHSVVRSEVIFETTALVGTYHFQPLAYFYQKTDLESNTRWALVIDWDSSGIDLYYNTGNGNTPTSVNLNDTAPDVGTDYKVILSNLGDQTYVYIQDITGTEKPIIYEGYTTTNGVYDARALYAGFGQYSSGSGAIYGWHDDFSIIDSTFTYSEDGTGFSKIDAYVDEVFTQTLYDIDGGANSTLEVDGTVTNITLLVDCWLNSTTYGVSLAEGKNIIRQNITVRNTNGTIVFSQANLTYISSADYGESVFWYQYSVELDFTIIYGEIYTVTVTYEVFYSEI